MTLISRILTILGSFWGTLFKDVLGLGVIQPMASVVADLIGRCYMQLSRSLTIARSGVTALAQYNSLIIDAASIKKAAPDIQSMQAQDLAMLVGTQTAEQLYTAHIIQSYGVPELIQDSQGQPSMVLALNMDYVIRQHTLYTTVDLRKLVSGELYQTAQGSVYQVVRLTGLYPQSPVALDTMSYITRTRYDEQDIRRVLWQIRIWGPSCMLIRKLCAAVLKSPVVSTSADQRIIWTQSVQNTNVVYTTNTAYASSYAIAPNVYPGALLQDGAYIFQGFRLIDTISDPQLQDIPGLHIKTSVGMYYAPNKICAANVDPNTGSLMLPLEPVDTPVEVYDSAVAQAYANALPNIAIPAQVNPMLFILKNIMHQRFIILQINKAATKQSRKRLQQILKAELPLGTVIFIQDLT